MAQFPKIAPFADGSGRHPLGLDPVSWVGCLLLEVGRQLIDFDRREAGDRDVKPFDPRISASSGSSTASRSRFQPAFSAILLSAIASARRFVSDRPCTSSTGTCPKSQQLCRGIAAVAGNDHPALVDHDRNHKSERRDAVGDLADLLLRVRPCIPRIRLERVNCETFYLGHEALLLTPKAKRAR